MSAKCHHDRPDVKGQSSVKSSLSATVSIGVLFVLKLLMRNMEKDWAQKLWNHWNQVNWDLASCISGDKSDKLGLLLIPCLLDLIPHVILKLSLYPFQGKWGYSPLNSRPACQNCLLSISSWMSNRHHKPNASKIQLLRAPNQLLLHLAHLYHWQSQKSLTPFYLILYFQSVSKFCKLCLQNVSRIYHLSFFHLLTP